MSDDKECTCVITSQVDDKGWTHTYVNFSVDCPTHGLSYPVTRYADIDTYSVRESRPQESRDYPHRGYDYYTDPYGFSAGARFTTERHRDTWQAPIDKPVFLYRHPNALPLEHYTEAKHETSIDGNADDAPPDPSVPSAKRVKFMREQILNWGYGDFGGKIDIQNIRMGGSSVNYAIGEASSHSAHCIPPVVPEDPPYPVYRPHYTIPTRSAALDSTEANTYRHIEHLYRRYALFNAGINHYIQMDPVALGDIFKYIDLLEKELGK